MIVPLSGDYFFFFQAEDGIRDVAVTGVQTCALPILSLGVGPYARTPRTLTVAPYVALGWAAAPVTGTPWVAIPGTRITLGLAFEWLGVFRWEAGYGTATHRLGLAFDVTRDFWGIL